ncbi:MAG: hypothetical protein OHK0045_24470 [Raineya sp.]
MKEEEKIEAYIQQMMRIKAKKEAEQAKSDLREISMELGMSEEDLQAVEEERKKMLVLGRGFIQHQQADDAISVLEKAYALNPDDAETLSLLAQAHGIKFVQSNQAHHKKKSEELAAQALLQNPEDQSALALLQSVRYQPKQEVQWGRVGILLALAAIVGFIGYSFFSGRGGDNSSQSESQVNKLQVEQAGSNNQNSNQEKNITYTNTNGDKAAFRADVVGKQVRNWRIEYDGKVLNVVMKGEKNKYQDAQGIGIAETKAKDADGFKMRTPDGQTLLWKVKLDAAKVKVSNNEENRNPYELKKKDGKIKISRNGVELANLKKVNTFSEAAMYLTDIPKEQRYILVIELLMREM